jgi:multidrug efflux pump subunit AcrA (membrane-fusion protein)
MKRAIPLLALLAVGGGVYWYTSRPVTSLVLTGIVTTNHIVVSPQITGRLDKLMVAEGDVVKADQLLAVLEPDELRQERAYYSFSAEGMGSQVQESEAAVRLQERMTTDQIAQAEANLEAVRLKEGRYKDLVKIKAVSQQDYDDAHAALKQVEADVASTRAAVETARINLAYTKVTAPISGRIGRSTVTDGALVTASQPTALATIQQLDAVDICSIETGAVRVNAGAPGLYIDGEQARFLALDVRIMLAFFEGKPVRGNPLGIAADGLRGLAALIEEHLPQVPPPGDQSSSSQGG